jgi:hypothetical protein
MGEVIKADDYVAPMIALTFFYCSIDGLSSVIGRYCNSFEIEFVSFQLINDKIDGFRCLSLRQASYFK